MIQLLSLKQCRAGDDMFLNTSTRTMKGSKLSQEAGSAVNYAEVTKKAPAICCIQVNLPPARIHGAGHSNLHSTGLHGGFTVQSSADEEICAKALLPTVLKHLSRSITPHVTGPFPS